MMLLVRVGQVAGYEWMWHQTMQLTASTDLTTPDLRPINTNTSHVNQSPVSNHMDEESRSSWPMMKSGKRWCFWWCSETILIYKSVFCQLTGSKRFNSLIQSEVSLIQWSNDDLIVIIFFSLSSTRFMTSFSSAVNPPVCCSEMERKCVKYLMCLKLMILIMYWLVGCVRTLSGGQHQWTINISQCCWQSLHQGSKHYHHHHCAAEESL